MAPIFATSIFPKKKKKAAGLEGEGEGGGGSHNSHIFSVLSMQVNKRRPLSVFANCNNLS
jgi:hypothetical protein